MPSIRPAMHARDSSGRQVSLLNDEPTPRNNSAYGISRSGGEHESSGSTPYTSENSPPTTPDLLRSDSYDSRNSNDPNSPITPLLMEFRGQSSYTTPYPDRPEFAKSYERASIYGSSYPGTKLSASAPARPSFTAQGSNSTYEEEMTSSSPVERSGSATTATKRYPCRYKDSHGCDKSFTTSGHASRHSKIHTAEKAVHCSFQGCQKKFTRADNMKQHLETHYKERSRSASHKSSPSSATRLTLPAGVKKHSSGSISSPSATHAASRLSRPTSRTSQRAPLTIDTQATFAQGYTPDIYSGASALSYAAQSPADLSPKSHYGPLDLHGFQTALPQHAMRSTMAMTGVASGLDALVAAAACQMGGQQSHRLVEPYPYGN